MVRTTFLKFFGIFLILIFNSNSCGFAEQNIFFEASSKNSKENILRVYWNVVPKAVKYEVLIDMKSFFAYSNGIEFPIDDVNKKFQVNAISLEGTTIQNNIPIVSVISNPNSPQTTTEFDKMFYPPTYLVYSWVPTYDADRYEIELLKGEEVIRHYFIDASRQKDKIFDFYDKTPLLEEGEYFWRIRSFSREGTPLTEWSSKNASNSFRVIHNTRFCSLGDSIIHGGGFISVPPSFAICNWETYCNYPVKNIGRSGDIAAETLARFENDVLTFQPEVLFIMTGVNDYRLNIPAQETISKLVGLRDKCVNNKIVPVFITPTPLNSERIAKAKIVDSPPEDWLERQIAICEWIRSQKNFIDVNDKLTNKDGNMLESLSIDGLHPDAEGKKIIGEAVSSWIKNYLENSKTATMD